MGTLAVRVEDAVAQIEPDLDPYAGAESVLERFGVAGGAPALGYARAPGRVRATVKGL